MNKTETEGANLRWLAGCGAFIAPAGVAAMQFVHLAVACGHWGHRHWIKSVVIHAAVLILSLNALCVLTWKWKWFYSQSRTCQRIIALLCWLVIVIGMVGCWYM